MVKTSTDACFPALELLLLSSTYIGCFCFSTSILLWRWWLKPSLLPCSNINKGPLLIKSFFSIMNLFPADYFAIHLIDTCFGSMVAIITSK
jgi:hypothetical protein